MPPLLAAGHRDDDLHLLREILRTQQALLAVFSRTVGMPAARLAVLRLLALADPRPLGVMQLARRLEINAAAVTRQVQEMEREGLVVRRLNARDKRRHSLHLTRKGRQIFQQLHERSHHLERSLAAMFSPEELKTAATVLLTLRGVLEGLR